MIPLVDKRQWSGRTDQDLINERSTESTIPPLRGSTRGYRPRAPHEDSHDPGTPLLEAVTRLPPPPPGQASPFSACWSSGGIAFQLVNPQLMARIIDGAMAGAEASTLAGLAVLFMVVAVAQQGLALAATWVGQRIGWAATNELRADLAEHIIRLDLGFHKQRTPGELIERIDGDVTALSNFFSQFVVHVVGNLVLLVGILVLLTIESLWIGLVMIVFAAISMVGDAPGPSTRGSLVDRDADAQC